MIPYGRHHIDEEDIAAVVEVLRHGALTQGPKVAEFEKAVADYVGARFAVAVSSGTAALHLACIAANVKSGDKVVTSPITFVASANCARYVGAEVIFSDIDPATINLDPEVLEQTCAKAGEVAAIIPVHFAGLPCDMPAIKKVADRYGARIIEDAAHALGAVLPDGSRVGACKYSDMTTFSFHPVKHIAAGEGGMITTNDEGIYRRLLRLRSHGINKEGDEFLNTQAAFEGGELNRWYYEMQELGFNFRLTDIQCALALSQFSKLDRFVFKRNQLAIFYDEAFSDFKSLRSAQLQQAGSHAYHLYVLRVNFKLLKISRTRFMARLAGNGIGTQVHYLPSYLHPYYQSRSAPAKCPEAEKYYEEALSIPIFFDLPEAGQRRAISQICELVK